MFITLSLSSLKQYWIIILNPNITSVMWPYFTWTNEWCDDQQATPKIHLHIITNLTVNGLKIRTLFTFNISIVKCMFHFSLTVNSYIRITWLIWQTLYPWFLFCDLMSKSEEIGIANRKELFVRATSPLLLRIFCWRSGIHLLELYSFQFILVFALERITFIFCTSRTSFWKNKIFFMQ